VKKLLCFAALLSMLAILPAATTIITLNPNDPASYGTLNTNFANLKQSIDQIFPDAGVGLTTNLYLWTNSIEGIDDLIGVSYSSSYISNFTMYLETWLTNAATSGTTANSNAQVIATTKYVEDALEARGGGGGASSSTNSAVRIADALSLERQALFITNIAGTVYCEIEATGGGDIDYKWDGADYTVDCTGGGGVGGRARSEGLTPGTDAVPKLNYLYVVTNGANSAILTNSTTHPNGTSFAWVGVVTLQSAGETFTNGPFALQRYSDTVSHNGRGRASYNTERLRQEGAHWVSGVAASVTIDNGTSPDSVYVDTSAGVVYQLHRQAWSALSITNLFPAYVINDSVTAYTQVTNLNQITLDADGDAFSGKRYALRLYGYVASGDDGESRLLISLPTGSYVSASGAQADTSNYDVNTIPSDIHGGAFNIARLVFYWSAAGGGTITLVENQNTRGIAVNSAGGGGGTAQSQEFPDSTFRVFDNADSTKEIAFEASGITAGNTRTITMADEDITLHAGTLQAVLDAGDTATNGMTAAGYNYTNSTWVTVTNKTDEGIVDAMARLPAAGGSIFLPPGNYKIDKTMAIPTNNIHWVGAGRDVVVLDAASYTQTNDLTLLSDFDYITFSGFRVNAQKAGGTIFSVFGDAGVRSDYCVWENVWVNGADGYAWEMDATAGKGHQFISCIAEDSDVSGFACKVPNSQYVNCRAIDNDDEGFEIDGVGSLAVVCHAAGNGGAGFKVSEPDCLLSGCISRNNGEYSFWVTRENVSLIGCKGIRGGNTYYQYYVKGADYFHIASCTAESDNIIYAEYGFYVDDSHTGQMVSCSSEGHGTGGFFETNSVGNEFSINNAEGETGTKFDLGGTSGSYANFIGGKFGIGTDAPVKKLHVYEPTATCTLAVESDDANATVQLDGGGLTDRVYVEYKKSGTKYKYAGLTDSSVAEFDGTEYFIGEDADGDNSQLLIDGNGLVGIGTNIPAYLLHVDGTNYALAFTNAAGSLISEFSTDGTLAGDSDAALPTEKAVKTYVDALASTNWFSIEVQDPTNGLVYWAKAPFDGAHTLIEAFVKTHGMTCTVDVVRHYRTNLWYSLTTIETNIAGTLAGTSDTAFSSGAFTNGEVIGILPDQVSAFAITNFVRVDFKTTKP